MNLPIKRGTARRLGIRQPEPYAAYPQRWMVGMQEAVNNLHANLAAVRFGGMRPAVIPPSREREG